MNAAVATIPDENKGLSRTITFFLVLLAYVMILHFIGPVKNYKQSLLIDVLFASIVLIFFALNFRKTIELFKLPKKSPGVFAAIIVGAPFFGLIIFFLSGFLNGYLFGTVDEPHYRLFANSPSPILFTIISVGVFPAVFEEIACRGIMFNNLEKIAGVWPTIILTAIIFTMLHLSLLSALWIFPVGILFGMLRARYNTLWYGIIGHFLYNSSIVFFEILL